MFVPLGLAVTAIGIVWALAGGSTAEADGAAEAAVMVPRPAVAKQLPAVEREEAATVAPCTDPAVQAALASGDDNAAVAAFGGGAAFQSAVASGNAPCIDLGDPTRLWLVVNKTRPFTPLEYGPASLASPALVSDSAAGPLRSDVAQALDAMSAASDAAGVGELGLGSGYRSYQMQIDTYRGQVGMYGQAEADAQSARPGFSEHQSGLAADVEQCIWGECSGILDFGDTDAGQWVAEHSWEYGFIVRYVEGQTPATGYDPEPWHLRYVGTEIAAAYAQGGYGSLEQFFGLPAAPDYLG
nr:M15 family metallopeptidase [Microbacterium pseudoresistens]